MTSDRDNAKNFAVGAGARQRVRAKLAAIIRSKQSDENPAHLVRVAFFKMEMKHRRIDLRIESLTLPAMTTGGRCRLQTALEQELAGLFSGKPAPAAINQPKLKRARLADAAESQAREIAQQIHREISLPVPPMERKA